jgi:8-oxo-dGTP pyrophosphatase MutT (NUDIX family)
MRQFAQSLRNPLSRFESAAHFTGSAVVTDLPGERVCLVHHARLGRWLQPGGHPEEVDGGSLMATALREAKEETGCEVQLHPTAPRPFDIDVHQIPELPGSPAHLHLDLRFLAVASNPDQMKHDPSESAAARWLSWEDSLSMIEEPALRRMLKKAHRLCETRSARSPRGFLPNEKDRDAHQ